MSWVVFDYGGVICEHQRDEDLARLASAAGSTAAEFGAAYWLYRASYDRADLDAAAFWQKVGAALGRSFQPAQIQELTRLDVESWMHLRDGTVALVRELARAGHRLALLSNAPAEVAEAVTALPVASHFRDLVFSCFLRSAKPDPACYSAALARLGAAPAEVTFIDDRPENVRAATALGIRGLRFAGPGQARAQLARYGLLRR
jgi:putative hydrolase of the HAD superfamily